jgi:hypothetical protein
MRAEPETGEAVSLSPRGLLAVVKVLRAVRCKLGLANGSKTWNLPVLTRGAVKSAGIPLN